MRWQVLLLTTIILSLCLVLFASTLGGRYGAFHELTLELIGPLQSTFTKAASGARNFWADYVDLLEVRNENRRLKALLDSYDEKQAKYREAYTTFLHLQEELDFRKAADFPPLTARVIGKDPAFWFHTIIVADDPLSSVVLGSGRALDNIDILKEVTIY